MDFNQNLYQLRKKNGLSQEDLALKLDVARQTISKWELGETVPDMDKLILLSEIFEVSMDELVGNQRTQPKSMIYKKFHYEYISKKKVFGLPLVHIHLGTGLNRAKGIIAVGNVATGIISVGLVSLGFLSFGPLAIGLLCLASIAVGIFSFGAVAFGLLAVGGIAIGVLSIGGIAVGFYSIGGISIAKNIAYGGIAYGKIAIGDKTYGTHTFQMKNGKALFSKVSLQECINIVYPKIWTWIANLFCSLI